MTPYLIIPGWRGSEPDHWQSQWERALAGATRVEMPDWFTPRRSDWLGTLDRAIRSASEPPILIAHSLGCLAVAHWATGARSMVRGALLVAPPDLDRPDSPDALREFAPAPCDPLPFPSVVVASDDDPYASVGRVAQLARAWRSQLTVMRAAGHINRESGFGCWSSGRALLRYFDAPEPPHAGPVVPVTQEREDDESSRFGPGLG
jgi:predicted alpha/beta hydrolase family esterase